MPPMRADNSRHIITAARHRAEQTRQRAIAALRRLDAAGQPISFDAVARQASVSRSWLYAQQDLRTEIQRLRQLEADNQQLRDALARAFGERRANGALRQASRDTPNENSSELITHR